MLYKSFGTSAVSKTPARKSKISRQDSCVFYLQDLGWVWFMYSVGAPEDFAPKPLSYYNGVHFTQERSSSTHTVRKPKRGNLIRMYLVLQDVI